MPLDVLQPRRGWGRRLILVTVALSTVWLPGLDAASPKNKREQDSYTIGGVLSGVVSEQYFKETIEVRLVFLEMQLSK